jgi:hypothetical protein
MLSRVILATALSLGAPAVLAGTVTIAEDSANKKNIIVDVKDATTDEVLAALNGKHAFAVERLGDYSQAIVTRRYTGEFRHVLERVLDNVNHLVVTSERDREVQRVVIYGRHTVIDVAAAAPAKPAPRAPAAGTSPPPLDPEVVAAVERARLNAEAANDRGDTDPDPTYARPSRRSAMYSRGAHRGL